MSIITDEMIEKAANAYLGEREHQTYQSCMRAALEAVANDIIEACAKVCDERAKEYWGLTEEESASENCAARIRSLKSNP